MNKRLKFLVSALVISAVVTGCGNKSDNASLEKRVAELETENARLKEQLGQDYSQDDAGTKKEENGTEIPQIEVEASGVAGANITWEYGGGVLIFKGTGEMTNFQCDWSTDNKYVRPYNEYANEVVQVYFENGITCIGEGAISALPAVAKIVIPESVERIKASDTVYNPFNNNTLKEIDLSNVENIESLSMFSDGSTDTSIYVKLPDEFDCIEASRITDRDGEIEWRGVVYPAETICDVFINAGLYYSETPSNGNKYFSTTTSFE